MAARTVSMRQMRRRWPKFMAVVMVGLTGWRPIVSAPTIVPHTDWIDVVKRGAMPLQVYVPGYLQAAGRGRFKAKLLVPGSVAGSVHPGQDALIQLPYSSVRAKVVRVDEVMADKTVAVEVAFSAKLPKGLRDGLKVEGTIELGSLDNVLYVGWPVNVQPDSTASLFKLNQDGRTATRVWVKFGKASVVRIQVLDGLREGDQVILSDMSQYDHVDVVELY
jgi:hypothetical protein